MPIPLDSVSKNNLEVFTMLPAKFLKGLSLSGLSDGEFNTTAARAGTEP